MVNKKTHVAISKKKEKIDSEKVEKWLKNGAQPTDVVKRLFTKAGIK